MSLQQKSKSHHERAERKAPQTQESPRSAPPRTLRPTSSRQSHIDSSRKYSGLPLVPIYRSGLAHGLDIETKDARKTNQHVKERMKYQRTYSRAHEFFQKARLQRSKSQTPEGSPLPTPPSTGEQIQYHLARLAQKHATPDVVSSKRRDVDLDSYLLNSHVFPRGPQGSQPIHTTKIHASANDRGRKKSPRTSISSYAIAREQDCLTTIHSQTDSDDVQDSPDEGRNVSQYSKYNQSMPTSPLHDKSDHPVTDFSHDQRGYTSVPMPYPIPPLLGRKSPIQQRTRRRNQSAHRYGPFRQDGSSSVSTGVRSPSLKSTQETFLRRQKYVTARSPYVESEASKPAHQGMIDLTEDMDGKENSSSNNPRVSDFSPSLLPASSTEFPSSSTSHDDNEPNEAAKTTLGQPVESLSKRLTKANARSQQLAASEQQHPPDNDCTPVNYAKTPYSASSPSQSEPTDILLAKDSELIRRKLRLFQLKARIQASNRPPKRSRADQNHRLCPRDAPPLHDLGDGPVKVEHMNESPDVVQDQLVSDHAAQARSSRQDKAQHCASYREAVCLSSDSSSDEENTENDDPVTTEDGREADSAPKTAIESTSNHSTRQPLYEESIRRHGEKDFLTKACGGNAQDTSRTAPAVKRPLSPSQDATESHFKSAKVARVNGQDVGYDGKHLPKPKKLANIDYLPKRKLFGQFPVFDNLSEYLQRTANTKAPHDTLRRSKEDSSLNYSADKLGASAPVRHNDDDNIKTNNERAKKVEKAHEKVVAGANPQFGGNKSPKPPNSRQAVQEANPPSQTKTKGKEDKNPVKTPAENSRSSQSKHNPIISHIKRDAKRKAAERPGPICKETSKKSPSGQQDANRPAPLCHVKNKLRSVPRLGSNDESGLFVKEPDKLAATLRKDVNAETRGLEDLTKIIDFDGLFEGPDADESPSITLPAKEHAPTTQAMQTVSIPRPRMANTIPKPAVRSSLLDDLIGSLEPSAIQSKTAAGTLLLSGSALSTKGNSRKPMSLDEEYGRDLRESKSLSRLVDETHREPVSLGKKFSEQHGGTKLLGKVHRELGTVSPKPSCEVAMNVSVTPKNPVQSVVPACSKSIPASSAKPVPQGPVESIPTTPIPTSSASPVKPKHMSRTPAAATVESADFPWKPDEVSRASTVTVSPWVKAPDLAEAKPRNNLDVSVLSTKSVLGELSVSTEPIHTIAGTKSPAAARIESQDKAVSLVNTDILPSQRMQTDRVASSAAPQPLGRAYLPMPPIANFAQLSSVDPRWQAAEEFLGTGTSKPAWVCYLQTNKRVLAAIIGRRKRKEHRRVQNPEASTSSTIEEDKQRLQNNLTTSLGLGSVGNKGESDRSSRGKSNVSICASDQRIINPGDSTPRPFAKDEQGAVISSDNSVAKIARGRPQKNDGSKIERNVSRKIQRNTDLRASSSSSSTKWWPWSPATAAHQNDLAGGKSDGDYGEGTENSSDRSLYGGKRLKDPTVQAYYAKEGRMQELFREETITEAEERADRRHREPSPITEEDALHFIYRVERKQWKIDDDENEAVWFCVGNPGYYSLDTANSAANYEVTKERRGIHVNHTSEHQSTFDKEGMRQWFSRNELGCLRVRVVRMLRDQTCGKMPESKKGWKSKQAWIVNRARYRLHRKERPERTPDATTVKRTETKDADALDDLFDGSESEEGKQDTVLSDQENDNGEMPNASTVDSPANHSDDSESTKSDESESRSLPNHQLSLNSISVDDKEASTSSVLEREAMEIPGSLYVDLQGGTWSFLDDANQRAKNLLLDACYDPASRRIDVVNGRFEMQRALERMCTEMEKAGGTFDAEVEVESEESGGCGGDGHDDEHSGSYVVRVWVEMVKANGPWN